MDHLSWEFRRDHVNEYYHEPNIPSRHFGLTHPWYGIEGEVMWPHLREVLLCDP